MASKDALSKIFKAYDIRGVYGDEIDESVVYSIGKSIVSFLKCREIIVGYDMRISSPKLVKAFSKGIVEMGVDVIDIGKVCTDATYFASGFMKKPSVMFTASHNPKQYNGLKITKESAMPINQNTGLSKIKTIIEKNRYSKVVNKKGRLIKKNILENYVSHARSFVDVKKLRGLKIAVDAGNGMAGKIAPLIYKNLGVRIVPLYFKLDGTFPNHPADPSKYENLKDLQRTVITEKCSFGMAFDGDADRIFFVDETGKIASSSMISSLIIKKILQKNPGKKIIYNVVCSKIVEDTIKKFGGNPIVERVGHSFIKETMRKKNAFFACEHSAHYYYRDNYMADSGMITSLIVAEIVATEKKPISFLLREFEKYYSIEETSLKVTDKESKINDIKNKK